MTIAAEQTKKGKDILILTAQAMPILEEEPFTSAARLAERNTTVWISYNEAA